MAKLINHDLTYVSFPISKVEKTEDGDLLVWGKATDGSVDSDEQIVDPDWSAKALGTWLSTGGNVRVMHSAQHLPAGKGVELDTSGGDGHYVRSLVVEPAAKNLVSKGVLQAYSIGISNPKIIRDRVAKGGRIVGGDIHELSLVDRPANKNCGITLVKSADGGASEEVEELFGTYDEPLEPVTKVETPVDDVEDDDDATENDDITEDGDNEDIEKMAYRAARTEWMSREPRPDHGDAPQTGTAFLAKRASWQRWSAEGEEAGLDDAPDGYGRWLAKRQMDPNVGGGIDRDKVPAANFVDPEGRRFPVVKPGDVADAVSSYGRAKPPIPMETFKTRLTAIAHRLGPEFVAELPASWTDKAEAPTDVLAKGVKACPNADCGAEHHADSKLRRCEKCGTKLPKAKKNKGLSEFNLDPGTIDDGVPTAVKGDRALPADTAPAGAHREPDGSSTVEVLEHDAGMATDTDQVPDRLPASVKTVSVYTLKRMHDSLCAAFDWDQVVEEYPALKSVSDAVEPSWFRDQVVEAVTKGDMPLVARLAADAQSAEALTKGAVEPAMLADARALVHKAFSDLHHGAAVAMKDVTPGQFQRPYLSAGHAPLSAPSSRPASVPPSSHVPDPDDFDRPLITAGHEAEAPGSRGDNLDTTSVASGSSRHFYTTASREAARSALQALHDHIQATFPDMCPMAASKSVLPPDMGDTNVPRPVQPLVTPKAPGEKSAGNGPLSKKSMAKLIKSAIAEATKGISETYEQQIAALQAEINELGAQPDPAQAPMRGVVRKAAATDDEPAPVERMSLVEAAQAQAATSRDEEIAFVAKFLNHPDPAKRESAEARLRTLAATP